MSDRPDITSGKTVKTDEEGRTLQVIDTEESWAMGFSYSFSWDEAMKNAISAARSHSKLITFELWDQQGIGSQSPPTRYFLTVGFYYQPNS